MGDGIALLRMLEPAVRPDGIDGRAIGAAPPVEPIESRGFEAILADVAGPVSDTVTASDLAPDPGPLETLADLDWIENGTVRDWLQHRVAPLTERPAPPGVGAEE